MSDAPRRAGPGGRAIDADPRPPIDQPHGPGRRGTAAPRRATVPRALGVTVGLPRRQPSPTPPVGFEHPAPTRQAAVVAPPSPTLASPAATTPTTTPATQAPISTPTPGPSVATPPDPHCLTTAEPPIPPRSRRAWWWLLVPLALFTLLPGDDRNVGQAGDLNVPLEADDLPAIDLPAIDLPPPHGNAPRTRALTTRWLVGPEVIGPHDGALSRELNAALDYLIRWSAVGDGLALGEDPPRGLRASPQSLRDQLRAPHALSVAPGDHPRGDHARPDDHRSLVVLTEDTAAWFSQLLPPVAEEPARWAEDRVRNTGHVLVLSPGAGRPAALDRAGPLPAQVAVDPTEPGVVTEALARAWVEAYGGDWSVSGQR